MATKRWRESLRDETSLGMEVEYYKNKKIWRCVIWYDDFFLITHGYCASSYNLLKLNISKAFRKVAYLHAQVHLGQETKAKVRTWEWDPFTQISNSYLILPNV
jgi:hypothetical protein